MIKMFKLRYMLCWRVDSQNFLKILIIFNIFLGLYLLFLSTDRRRVSEYPLTNQPKVVAESLKKVRMICGLSWATHECFVYIQDDAEPPSVSVVKTNNTKANPVDQSEIKVSNGFSNDQLSVVEKIYDSNNKLVVQEPDKNDDVKRVEEDDKTLDEIDKLRIEMIDKQGNLGNSIIHDLEFSDDKQHKSAAKNDSTNVAKANDYLSKDVINRILDHNQHINKNTSKLISPDSVTAESFWWSLEKHGNYQVLRDYIPGNIPSSFDMKSITLTTQGTSDFLHHAEQLCDRWDGFISLAVYAPGDDFRLAINIIYYLRQCTNRCISDRVYWHMVFDSQYAPINISTPASYLEAQNFDCNLPLKDTLKSLKLSSDFRKFKSLPYPINVLRNVARNATKTKYLLASDIELYPSIGIVPAFFDLLERERIGQVPLINANNPHVYVLPIFETKSTKKSPRTKTELSTLFHSRKFTFLLILHVNPMLPPRRRNLFSPIRL